VKRRGIADPSAKAVEFSRMSVSLASQAEIAGLIRQTGTAHVAIVCVHSLYKECAK